MSRTARILSSVGRNSISSIAPYNLSVTAPPAFTYYPWAGSGAQYTDQFRYFNVASKSVNVPPRASMGYPGLAPPVNAPIMLRMPDFKGSMPPRTRKGLTAQEAIATGMEPDPAEAMGKAPEPIGSFFLRGAMAAAVLTFVLYYLNEY